MSMPINGQPKRTMNTPPKKNSEPFTFCTPKKNLTVRSRPIIKQRPHTNKIFPIANNPLSNKNNIPSSRKNMPKPDRPIPISTKKKTF